MGKRKRRVTLAVLLAAGMMLLLLGGMAFVTFGQEEEATVPEIPGITVDDVHVNGCVDCHRKADPEKDYRISTNLRKLAEKGKHPDVEDSTKTIPGDCLTCHSESAAKMMGTEPLASMLHRFHLLGGEENHFITNDRGRCTHCHALNKDTGEFSIKSGKEQ